MIKIRSCVIAFLTLAAAAPLHAEEASPTVVELFTSQGCNSCPPADAYLRELAHRPGILALAFHVDYWNYIGWTDPFAHAWASERQRGYMHSLHERYVYTPQMVIDGRAQGVGSEHDTIETLLRAAPAQRPPHPDLSLQRRDDGALVVHVGAGTSPEGEPATIWLISYDKPRITKVLHGENEGQTLTDYQAVRSYRRIGAWPGWALELIVPAADTASLGDGGIVVLVQAAGTGPILAAARIDQPPASDKP
jgi:hypothetical protein